MTQPPVLQLHAAGLAPFPCRRSPEPKKDKKPVVKHWKGGVDPIAQDWTNRRIGVPIPHGTVVIDLDTYKGVTREAVDKLLGCTLPWDRALLQTTQHGGQHYGFRAAWPVRQRSNLHGLKGFDTRVGGKGYICTGEPDYTPCNSFGVFRLARSDSLPRLPDAARHALERVEPLATPTTSGAAPPPPDWPLIRDALKHIPPNCGRDTWRNIGMALKTVTDDVTLWDQWSSGMLTGTDAPHNYVAEHIQAQWPGLKPTGGITIATLFHEAKQAGWKPSPSRVDTAAAFGPIAGPGRKDIIVRRIADGPMVGALMQNPTEDNVALAFGEIYAGEYIYMTGRRCWFRWDSTRWRRDELLAVREVVRQLARAHNVEGKAAPAKNSFITGVLGIAQSDPRFSMLASDFDQDNYLLNCPDGTYDLSGTTVTRHEHRPGDHITKLTAVSPQPGGGERFLQFLQEIFEGNNDLIDWVQRALGACLSGAIEDHWIMFWTGAGRNGKNTLGDLVMRVLGDYAKAVPADTLMSKKNQEHKTEIVNLMGVRLAVASEIEESDFWAESKLKSLTGDAMLSGRYMYKDFVEFERTHKHLIYGNHRPQLRNIDAALRARMKVVPFRESFLGREDADLGAKLWAESSFVLHWLIEGHRGWLAMGKNVGSCAVIDAEVEEYLSEQATVDNWVAEHCRRVPDDGRALRGWPRASELYSSFKHWSTEMGVGVRSQMRFSASLQNMGFKRVVADGKRYVGIELKPPLGRLGTPF